MPKFETVEQHLKLWLKENGFDGLYSAGECACKLDDLQPCEGPMMQCKPGYLTPCDCGEHDFHISENVS